MSNIFEHMQFGNLLQCRDGNRAVFLSMGGNPPSFARVYHEDYGLVAHNLDGRVMDGEDSISDIVSRWDGEDWIPLPVSREWLQEKIASIRQAASEADSASCISYIRGLMESRAQYYEKMLNAQTENESV